MYAVFAGDDHYPNGGWEDLLGVFETLEAAREAALRVDGDYRWYHIVDLRIRAIVEAG